MENKCGGGDGDGGSSANYKVAKPLTRFQSAENEIENHRRRNI